MTPVDLGPLALLTLLPLSALAGILTAFVFARFTNHENVRGAVDRILAHLLELRLFFDEPVLILRAQRDLILANGNLLRLLAVPMLILAIPFALLFMELNAVYGRAPLVVGQAAIVTAPLQQAVLETPPGIAIETPPVHISYDRRTCWRIRPSRRAAGLVRAGDLTARIFAGGSLIRPSLGAFSSLQISYPAAAILGLPWLLWFFLGSGAGALLHRLARMTRRA